MSLFGAVADHYVAAGDGAGATYVTSSNGTGALTMPSGVATGDHIVIALETGSATPPTVTGFRRLHVRLRTVSGTATWSVFYRTADGTEGSTLSGTGLGVSLAYVIAIYRGGYPPTIVSSVATATAATSLPSRSRVPVAGTVLHLLGCASSTATVTISTPSGTANRDSAATTNFCVRICDENGSAGDDNTRTATITSGAGCSMTLLFPTTAPMPYLVASATNNNNSANATITIPSTAQAGDLAIVGYEVTANLITAGPSGFTAIDSGQATGGSYSCNYWWGYKVLVAGDVGAAKAVTSGSQVWGASCLVLRSPAATPLLAAGTKKNGTAAAATWNAATAAAPALAVYALFGSVNNNSTDPAVDQTVAAGLDWQAIDKVDSSFGWMCLGLGGVPNGGASLAASAAQQSGATWETVVALLNAA